MLPGDEDRGKFPAHSLVIRVMLVMWSGDEDERDNEKDDNDEDEEDSSQLRRRMRITRTRMTRMRENFSEWISTSE